MTEMKNRICELLGIEYPLLQGGMAWVSTAELAAAVSNAGGVGLIAAGNAPADYVRDQIHKARELTNQPFGVNVMLLSPYADDVMKMLLEEKIAVITTGAGNPGQYIPALKEVGTHVIPVIPSVALAQRMQRCGADAVVAEGCESGGHIGELTTMTLVPMVVDAVDIPVIAAGGIADRRGVAAALALGAEGVQVGTRFICSDECTVHENYKAAVVGAKDRDAVVTGRFTGHPVRNLKNKLTRSMDKIEKEGDIEAFNQLGAGALRSAAVDGDVQMGSVMAGQSAGLVHDIKPCSEIVKDLFDNIAF